MNTQLRYVASDNIPLLDIYISQGPECKGFLLKAQYKQTQWDTINT